MAKQTGAFPIVGTFDNITYYMMNGKPYARRKSSLTKKKFMTHPNFKNSRRSSTRFASGSRLGSRIYNECFPGARDFQKYQQIAGEATKYLKEEYTEAEVLKKLRRKYKPVSKNPAVKKQKKSKPVTKKAAAKKQAKAVKKKK